MQTKAIKDDSLNAILRALTPTNRLVALTALSTGMRIGDVLNIKTEQLKKDRFTVFESKTGKKKTVRLPRKLRERLAAQAGRVFVFENRLSMYKPRTRGALWKDMNRIARLYRLKGLAPHSLRKTYARALRAEGLTLPQIQKALNHSSESITRLYALADELGMK